MTMTPAGWYPDQSAPGMLRYWDGVTWTSHVAPGGSAVGVLNHTVVRPGLVGVWITAVLSLFTFFVRTTDASGHTSTISIPLGIISMIICWSLISRAQKYARSIGVKPSDAYRAARIVSGILAGLSVLNSVLSMAAN